MDLENISEKCQAGSGSLVGYASHRTTEKLSLWQAWPLPVVEMPCSSYKNGFCTHRTPLQSKDNNKPAGAFREAVKHHLLALSSFTKHLFISNVQESTVIKTD